MRPAGRSGHTPCKTETSVPALPSSLASASVERVSPASPLPALFPLPSVAIPVPPSWDFHPIGSSLLLQLHVYIQPLRSTVVTRFFATMGCPTPAIFHLAGLPGSLTHLSPRAASNHPG